MNFKKVEIKKKQNKMFLPSRHVPRVTKSFEVGNVSVDVSNEVKNDKIGKDKKEEKGRQ